jgi:predicted nucleic acid-binding protein
VIADFRVVLDACVLANYAVANVFLTFAEEPRLFLPRWSVAILDETGNAQIRLGWEERLAANFNKVLREHFPEALVTGYEPLVEQCKNDEKDRHVLACAIHCNAEVIVTFNLRDFPDEALKPWNIIAMHPQDQLLSLYGLDHQIGLYKLLQIANRRKKDLKDYLIDLGRFVPAFCGHVLGEIG